MSNTPADDILDDAFHAAAFSAYVELAIATGGPPDVEATRRRAYELYEQTLAARSSSKSVKSEVR